MKKEIIIKEIDGEVKFTSNGFNQFEIIGLLTHYRDVNAIDVLNSGIAQHKTRIENKDDAETN